MNGDDHAQIDELIEHTKLLLDNAKDNLDDIKKAMGNPAFLKSMLKKKELDLKRQISEILRGQQELKNWQQR